MQYLSDESEKDDKIKGMNSEEIVKVTTPDVILVEDDSGEEITPRKKRHRSNSESIDHKKMVKLVTERRIIVDITRDRKFKDELNDKRRESDRRREDKIKSKDDLKKVDKSLRKVLDKSKEQTRKDDSRKRIEDDRRKREESKKHENKEDDRKRDLGLKNRDFKHGIRDRDRHFSMRDSRDRRDSRNYDKARERSRTPRRSPSPLRHRIERYRRSSRSLSRSRRGRDRHPRDNERDRDKNGKRERGDKYKDSLSEGLKFDRSESSSEEELKDIDIEEDEDEEAIIEKRRKQREELLKRLGGPAEDSNLSADMSVIAVSPRTINSNSSPKSVEVVLNNNESASESHTPPLPDKEKFQQPIKRRKSRFDQLPVAAEIPEEPKVNEKPCVKKSNEWDMFAEADNIGDFNSPTVEGKRLGGPENPSLTDNWDDAEGYYR